MIESIALGVVLLAPALLFLGWISLVGIAISALGASTDTDLDESRLLKPRARPS